jgi:colicin import membrane protein
VYLGLLVSVLMHAGLLGWTVISIQSTPELRSPMIEPVAVDMITPSELTRLTKGSREATLKEARPKESQQADPAPKEGPRPRPITAAPPPPPPPEPPAQAPDSPPPPKVAAATPPPPPPAVEPPKPEPDKAALEQKLADLAALQKVEEAKLQAEAKAKAEAEAKAQADAAAKAKAEAEAKAKAEAEAKAKAEADAKRVADAKAKADLKRKQDEKRRADAERKRIAAEKEKAKFSADRLSELLDKSPDPRAPAPAAPETKSDTLSKGPVRGAPEGRDDMAAASKAAFLAGLMKNSVERCWNVIAGLKEAEAMSIRINVRFNRDGTFVEPPRLLSSGGSPMFGMVADGAMRALVRCAPYALPPEDYEYWANMNLNFDPKKFQQ